MIQNREETSAREYDQMRHEKEMLAMQSEHVQAVKKLELELALVEAKWASWLKIPLTLVKLPVLIVFGVAYCIAIARKHEPSEDFWRFVK